MGDSYLQAVRDWAALRFTKDWERFLCFSKYHRRFIAGYAQVVFPLYRWTGKKPFIWGQEQQTVFDALKKTLTELSQIQEGQEKPIVYGSLSPSAEKRIYCTTQKELLWSWYVSHACAGTTVGPEVHCANGPP